METISSAKKFASAVSTFLVLVGLVIAVVIPVMKGEPVGTVCVFTHEEMKLGCVSPKEQEEAEPSGVTSGYAAAPSVQEVTTTTPTKPPSNPVIEQNDVTFPQSVGSLILSQQGMRSQSEITSTFPNPPEADALFIKWGWIGSGYKEFTAPSGVAATDGIRAVDIGVHQLRGENEAKEAMQYFMTARADLYSLFPTDVESFGSISRALIGPVGDGNYEASVYAVVGSQVIRVTALSWNGYPLSYASEIMRQMVGDTQPGELPGAHSAPQTLALLRWTVISASSRGSFSKLNPPAPVRSWSTCSSRTTFPWYPLPR